jgi:hypothetical protein
MKESIEDNKLYMNYFCNEVPKENVW